MTPTYIALAIAVFFLITYAYSVGTQAEIDRAFYELHKAEHVTIEQ